MASSTKRKRSTRRPPARKRPAKRQQPQTRMVRTSERTSFNRCEWQWWQNYQLRRQPIREAPALRFGSLVHQALEARYPPGVKRGPKPAETFEKLYEANLKDAYEKWGFRDEEGDWAEAGQLGVAMLENYVKTYGRDEEWKVIASEMTFQVPVYAKEVQPGVVEHCAKDEEGALHLFTYVGTMDGVWQNRMDNGIRVNDYKTTSSDPVKEARGKQILDEQGTAYWTWGVDWLIQEGILPARQVRLLDGMLYTWLYKAGPDERPVNAQGQSLNQDGSVSKKQPTPRFHREVVYRDREQTNRARRRAVRQVMRMELIRHGGLLPYKSPGQAYPDQQCKACPFFDICELDEIGADASDLAASTLTEWDPYDAHELQEEARAH